MEEKKKNYMNDKREFANLFKDIKRISSDIERFQEHENEFKAKIVKNKNLYFETLRTYGDSGNNKILSQLEKTYKIFKNTKDIDIDEIINIVEQSSQIDEEMKPDLSELKLGRFINLNNISIL
jgi:hypothetical protein